ncbi:MAG: hypothetical protein ACREEP_03320, partial [Dongiaceae bacterium]
ARSAPCSGAAAPAPSARSASTGSPSTRSAFRVVSGTARAHPADEHFLPLFFALGAAPGDYRAERFFDTIESGALAMAAYVFV